MSNFIWRIENQAGRGPYNGGRDAAKSDLNDGSYYGLNHPDPRDEDGMGYPEYDHIFGFSDIPSARRWWYSLHDLQDWEEKGYCLVAYLTNDCFDIRTSKTQTMFKPGSANKFCLPASRLHLDKIEHLELMAIKELCPV